MVVVLVHLEIIFALRCAYGMRGHSSENDVYKFNV